ncbi:methyl-accepting chemotaxis protein [Paludibacterium yongneupense]|uniref:methyl-accepting chemotaxis protein n=1 Tax=Paludibacterium yongneupense TaxID=400061 RepID=UPI000687DF4A|nr:methyl-accepting chemotaxis protein [Paludibacterium yongneupense]
MLTSLTFKKALIAFGALTMLLQCSLLAVTIVGMNYLEHAQNEDFPHASAYSNTLMLARYDSVQVQQFLTDASLTGSAGSFKEGKEHYELLKKALTRIAELHPEQQATVSALQQKADFIYQTGVEMAHAYLEKGKAAGNAIMERPKTGFDDSTSEVDGKLQVMHNAAQQSYVDLQQSLSAGSDKIRWMEIAGLFLVLSVNLLLIWWLYRYFVLPLAHMQYVVVDICDHLDFSHRIPMESDRKDEVGKTVVAINRLVEKLQATLKNLRADVHALGGTVSSLTQSSGKVSDSCNSQSSAVSAMATGVEQMAAGIGQVVTQAEQAREISSQSGQLAKQGRTVIEITVQDIHQISRSVRTVAEGIQGLVDSSQQIENVAREIGEIADQTNLLALNAAIEAARAGEAGRGFAVVADEVRKLAERTASSTREITRTIQGMRENATQSVLSTDEAVSRVDQGVARAGQVTETIHSIEQGSSNTARVAQEISQAIKEQNEVSIRLSEQIDQVASTTQKNSVVAQNTHDVATEIDSLAHRMMGMIADYKV